MSKITEKAKYIIQFEVVVKLVSFSNKKLYFKEHAYYMLDRVLPAFISTSFIVTITLQGRYYNSHHMVNSSLCVAIECQGALEIQQSWKYSNKGSRRSPLPSWNQLSSEYRSILALILSLPISCLLCLSLALSPFTYIETHADTHISLAN